MYRIGLVETDSWALHIILKILIIRVALQRLLMLALHELHIETIQNLSMMKVGRKIKVLYQ
jgi:hypothetical protein